MHAYAAPSDGEPAVDLAFEHLYRRYVEDVYRYTLAVLRNPSDAEDVTQTTFLNAYRAFKRGEQPRKPEHWLIKIAHNACRTRYLRNARRPVEVPLDESLAHVPVPANDEMDVEELLAALGELPFRQRAALVMRELDGRSYREIAETLEVTVPAVETLIFRARRRLRADRAALRGLAAVPLPPSLASFVGGGGAVTGGGALLGTGFAFKVVLMLAAGLVAGGVATKGFDATASPPSAARATAVREPAQAVGTARAAKPRATVVQERLATLPALQRAAARPERATIESGRAAILPAGAHHAGTISTAPRADPGAPTGGSPAADSPSGSAAPPFSAPSGSSSAPSGSSSNSGSSSSSGSSSPAPPVSTVSTTASNTATAPAPTPAPDVSVPSVPPPPALPALPEPVASLVPPPPPLPKLP